MSAKDRLRSNKTTIQEILCGDHRLVLNKVHEKKLITGREYNNLKSINKEDVEGHVVELVDKVLNKGEDTCQAFLNLLQTDDDIRSTFPQLNNIQLNICNFSSTSIQASSGSTSDSPKHKRLKECFQDEQYQLNSHPVGLCLIINNEKFVDGSLRRGTNKDAQSLSEVFSELGFIVLMCKDQTQDQMNRALKCFASLSDLSQLQEFDVKQWCNDRFIDLQLHPKHGDAFICCILSHGRKGAVYGIDWKPLEIKQITRTFKGTEQSALTGRPKVFLIQACQGGEIQQGVLVTDVEADASPLLSIPEEADVLVAMSTVEDHASFRHAEDGGWFIQSVCRQLKDGCPRGDDISTILHRVNNEVGQKEGASDRPGKAKQMPEFRDTLRKNLVLTPHFT